MSVHWNESLNPLMRIILEAHGAPKPLRPVIRTEFIYPPIPDRRFDWSATFDGYEPPDPIGYGPTEFAALVDLLVQWEAE